MRLTQYMRTQIETNVLAELPKTKDIRYYQELIKPIVEKDAYEQLPDKVKAVWDDNRTRPYIKIMYHSFPEINMSVAIPYFGDPYGYNGHHKFTLTKSAEKEVSDLIKEYSSMNTERNAAIVKLRTALNSCHTVKTLKERYPELVRYFPTNMGRTAAMAGVPAVISPLADFKKLGLPLQEPLDA